MPYLQSVIAGFAQKQKKSIRRLYPIAERIVGVRACRTCLLIQERPGTVAARKYEDDIPEEVKKGDSTRLSGSKIICRWCTKTKPDIGKTFKVLIEGDSKRSDKEWKGRNSSKKMVVFPKKDALGHKPGTYVNVCIKDATSATLIPENWYHDKRHQYQFCQTTIWHHWRRSIALERALLAVRVATTDLTVLIQGESGVGREIFSRIIHELSKRKYMVL